MTSAFVPSFEQTNIFGWFQDGRGNLVVKARAGTGKTTTIKAAFNHAADAHRILYAVFNKRNQKEAAEKITDRRVEVKTLHSLGFAFIKSAWRNAKPDDEIEWERAEFAVANYHFDSTAVRKEVVSAIVKLVSFAKNTTLKATSEDMFKIANDRDIYVEGFETGLVCRLALDAMESAKTQDVAGRISFDDMVWLPVVMGWVKPWYDLVVVDEAQDMNLPQLTMARLACSKGGRVVVVGDDRQAIYGFRGAVQNGMAMMKVQLRAQELGLTTTYRCAKSIVALARETVADYNAADSAPEGTVTNGNEATMMKLAKPGDAILSRLNAPLMPVALALIRAGTPARIEGRDVAKQLITMVRTLKAATVEAFLEKLKLWEEKQRARLSSMRNADKKLEQVSDVADTLRAVAEFANTVGDIERKLTELFQDTDSNSKPAVVLSTVHKAKGLEWNRVFILRETFTRKGGKPSANDATENANIWYVAVTRAKTELCLVSGGSNGEVAAKAEGQPAANDLDDGVSLSRKGECSSEAQGGANPLPSSIQSEASRLDASTWESPLPGSIYRERGCVFMHGQNEYVVVRLTKSSATCVCLTRQTKVIKTTDGDEKQIQSAAREIIVNTQMDKGDLVRRMSEQELEDFLSGKTRRARAEQADSGINNVDGENTMKKATKAKGTAKNKDSMKGAAQFIRDAVAKGDQTDAQIKKVVYKKFPWFADGNDAEGLASRFKTAHSRAKNLREKEAAAAKSAARKTGAPAKKGSKKPSAKSTPPPRKTTAKAPAKPAATAAVPPPPPRPAAAPIPAEGEAPAAPVEG